MMFLWTIAAILALLALFVILYAITASPWSQQAQRQSRTIGIVAGCYLVCFVTALLYRLA
jgi:threonine/homoserine/homoserine lactone efflux protein